MFFIITFNKAMSLLLELVCDISALLYDNYLVVSVNDLLTLDSAMCNRNLRRKYLSWLADQRKPMQGYQFMSMSLTKSNYLAWLSSRNLKIENLCVNSAVSKCIAEFPDIFSHHQLNSVTSLRITGLHESMRQLCFLQSFCNLTAIDTSSWVNISKAELLVITQNIPNIRVINVSNNLNLDPEVLESIGLHCAQVTSVDLNGSCQNLAAECLIKLVSSCKLLLKLDLNGQKQLTNEQLENLFASNDVLNEVSLHLNNRITHATMIDLVVRYPRIKRITASGLSIEDHHQLGAVDKQLIAEGKIKLSATKPLYHVHISVFNLQRPGEFFQHQSVQNTLELLSEKLPHRLTSLAIHDDYHGQTFTDDSVWLIARHLSDNLLSLTLDGQFLTVGSMNIALLSTNCPQLTKFTLHQAHLLQDSDVSILMSNCELLCQLTLHHCIQLTDNALHYIAKRKRKMITLVLKDSVNFTNEAMCALLDDLSDLDTFGVTMSPSLNNEMLFHMTNTKCCAKLAYLFLYECKLLTDNAICPFLKMHSALNYVWIEDAPLLTNRFISHLLEFCTEITGFYLTRNKNISTPYVVMFIQNIKWKEVSVGLTHCSVQEREFEGIVKNKSR